MGRDGSLRATYLLLGFETTLLVTSSSSHSKIYLYLGMAVRNEVTEL